MQKIKHIKKHEVSFGICDSHNDALKIRLRSFLTEAASIYPEFDAWYYFKFLRNIGNDMAPRHVIYAHDGSRLLGASLLKADLVEKKICSFKIDPSARLLGVGEELMKKSLAYLNSDDNLITVTDSKTEEFSPLLSKMGFKIVHRSIGLYSDKEFENYWRSI